MARDLFEMTGGRRALMRVYKHDRRRKNTPAAREETPLPPVIEEEPSAAK